MDIGAMYTLGWLQILNIQVIVLLFAGVLMGIILGILPGLGPTLAIAVFTPFTFGLDITSSMGFILGLAVGGTYGGSISSILCCIPGTPVAMMTTLDGYPMAQQGLAGKAIGIATIASFFGSIVAAIILSFAAPAIAKAALKFSSPEYFAIAFFGISIIAYISPGSMVKGLIMGFLGLLLGVVGPDPLTAFPRFTFKRFELLGGVGYFPVLIGLFGAAETLRSVQRYGSEKKIQVINQIGRVLPTVKEFFHIVPTIIRGAIVGTFVGAVPAAGGTIASIMNYGIEKRISKDPESFGRGNPRGVAAPEAANNAATSGAMIPLLTLGIPGDPGTAAMMGVFLIHGLTLGPMLFTNRANDVSAINNMLAQSSGLKRYIAEQRDAQRGHGIAVDMGLDQDIVTPKPDR